jgi:hypothetical protein
MGVVCFICALILLVSVEENKKNQVSVGLWSDVGLDNVEDVIGTW